MKISIFNLSLAVNAMVVMGTLIAADASAHDGRRLDIQVRNNQLVAQGFLSNPGPNSNDGGGLVRPYLNVIHDHFTNAGGVAFATLPGFDINNPQPLQGSDVTLELLGVSRWTPPASDGTGLDQDFGVPVLESLSPAEQVQIGFPGSGQSRINSDEGGAFILASNISDATADADIDLDYIINLEPEGTIYALQWQLSTTQPGIANSDSVYILLSPDGVGTSQRLHFQSLALESFLGITTAVPEPGSMMVIGLAMVPLALRRKRLAR
jgi:hypothetical protein